ncbi:hypothetical protein [Halobaculum rarum]|uniref:DUF7845 domain-containing protein n=1 Tax=Halobaculum rarum TaxID=3075122 RepID=UPI0032B000B6
MNRPCFLDLAPHEAEGWLNYETGNLKAFVTLAELISREGGCEVTTAFEIDSRVYQAYITPKQSGLQPPKGNAHGIDSDASTVSEYVLTLQPGDGVGGEDDDTRSFTLHPRWPNMGTAFDPEYVGISAEFHGVNEHLDVYLELLLQALSTFGVEVERFDLRSGVVTTFEQYARVNADYSAPLVRRGGVLDRADGVTTSEMGTDRPIRDNREVVGRHREVHIPTVDASNLFDGHSVGATIKHYFGKFLRSPETARKGKDPLAHPKLGVCFKKGLTDGDSPMLTTNGAVRWSERDQLVRELEERVLSILGWAGLPTRAKDHADVFVSDHYFEAADSERDRTLFADSTDSLTDDQRAWVDAALLDREERPTDSEVAVIDTLVESGSASVGIVAERAGVSERTVYRAADNNPRLFQIHDREIGFITDVVRQAIGSIRERAGGGLTQLDTSESDSSDGKSPADENSRRPTFIEEMNDWGVMWNDSYPNKPKFDLGRVPKDVDPDYIMDDLYRAWCRSGRDREVFHRASFKWEKDDSDCYKPTYKLPP